MQFNQDGKYVVVHTKPRDARYFLFFSYRGSRYSFYESLVHRLVEEHFEGRFTEMNVLLAEELVKKMPEIELTPGELTVIDREGQEHLLRAQRWSSWDGTLDLLTKSEQIELQEMLSLKCFETLWDLPYSELQAAADLLAEKYTVLWKKITAQIP